MDRLVKNPSDYDKFVTDPVLVVVLPMNGVQERFASTDIDLAMAHAALRISIISIIVPIRQPSRNWRQPTMLVRQRVHAAPPSSPEAATRRRLSTRLIVLFAVAAFSCSSFACRASMHSVAKDATPVACFGFTVQSRAGFVMVRSRDSTNQDYAYTWRHPGSRGGGADAAAILDTPVGENSSAAAALAAYKAQRLSKMVTQLMTKSQGACRLGSTTFVRAEWNAVDKSGHMVRDLTYVGVNNGLAIIANAVAGATTGGEASITLWDGVFRTIRTQDSATFESDTSALTVSTKQIELFGYGFRVPIDYLYASPPISLFGPKYRMSGGSGAIALWDPQANHAILSVAPYRLRSNAAVQLLLVRNTDSLGWTDIDRVVEQFGPAIKGLGEVQSITRGTIGEMRAARLLVKTQDSNGIVYVALDGPTIVMAVITAPKGDVSGLEACLDAGFLTLHKVK